MKTYIILIALIAGVLVTCTPQQPSVPKGEYLIQGKLENVPDSILIQLFEKEGKVFNYSTDTLVNGEFTFRDTASVPRVVYISSFRNKGFSGALNVWVASGKHIKINGQNDLLRTWTIESDIPEQQEENQKRTATEQITQNIYSKRIVSIGDEMVDGNLCDTKDESHHISEFRGKYILLDFWGCICGPCIKSIPEMEQIISMYADKLVMIGIICNDPKNQWKEMVAEKKMGGNQWKEDQSYNPRLMTRYQGKGLPYYVLIAPDGKIQDMWHGYTKGDLIEKINRNLNE